MGAELSCLGPPVAMSYSMGELDLPDEPHHSLGLHPAAFHSKDLLQLIKCS